MEEIATKIVLHISLSLELAASIIIVGGLIQLFVQYFRELYSAGVIDAPSKARVRFGKTIAISLELLLGADVLETSIAPTWDDIGKLAAVATIRTVLNYFLEKELTSAKM